MERRMRGGWSFLGWTRRAGEDIKEIVLPPSLLYHRPKNTRLRGIGRGRGVVWEDWVEGEGEGRRESGVGLTKTHFLARKKAQTLRCVAGRCAGCVLSAGLHGGRDGPDGLAAGGLWPAGPSPALHRLLRLFRGARHPHLLLPQLYVVGQRGWARAAGPFEQGPLGLLSKGRWASALTRLCGPAHGPPLALALIRALALCALYRPRRPVAHRPNPPHRPCLAQSARCAFDERSSLTSCALSAARSVR